MTFLLTAVVPALATTACTWLVFYRKAPTRTRTIHALVRGSCAAVCYVVIYLTALLAISGLYAIFHWYSGGITAGRLQAAGLSAFSIAGSVLIATILWKPVGKKRGEDA